MHFLKTNFTNDMAYINKINNEAPLAVYIFYPKLSKHEQKGDFRHFFNNLNEDIKLNDCVIFLSLQSALQYSYYMHSQHVTLKAYVSRDAINGHDDRLTLKKGFLTKYKIEGCYMGGAYKGLYLPNPNFEIKNYLNDFEFAANQLY